MMEKPHQSPGDDWKATTNGVMKPETAITSREPPPAERDRANVIHSSGQILASPSLDKALKYSFDRGRRRGRAYLPKGLEGGERGYVATQAICHDTSFSASDLGIVL